MKSGDDSQYQEKAKSIPDNPAMKEPVWSYRGYELRSSDFTTAMVHFFRAEISRANTWRLRLDTTTNWAVVITVAVIGVAFGGSASHHSSILLSSVLITLFLYIEARRYRYYELWSSRVRLMETDFYAAMLVPPFHPSPDWAESLAESLLQPHFSISMWEAFGRRYRRNYMWIFAILVTAWIAKIWFFPTPAASLQVFLDRAAVGPLPGPLVISLILIYNLGLLLIGVATIRLQEASGEVFPRFFTGQEMETEQAEGRSVLGKAQAWFKPHGSRKQLVALIVTDQAQVVADRILKDMQRGVTALQGKGMYTGQEHNVLMCALTVTEVSLLKSLVGEVDPQAFVIVSPAQEILGKGFTPLDKADKVS
jgi:uncharacterized membrane protein